MSPTATTASNLEAFIDRSLQNLGVETLDLVQLHCPPTEVYYRPEVFEALDALVTAGKIRHYGVSVEKVEEALKAIEYPGVDSVQIIYNIFRQRPAELFFREAKARKVAIIARVPLASGLLTGKLSRDSQFAHRRSSQLQSSRRSVRRGRDLRRRALRRRARSGRDDSSVGAAGHVDGGLRPAMDSDGRRRIGGHSRSEIAGAGAGERGRK